MCLKFRTMRVNAGAGVHREHLSERLKSNRRMVKLDRGDARLILFGATLRALGLDELPQLINVLQGEMSIVGPRPCIPYEFEHYLPWHRRRCDTLPGLTGMWQVNGKNRTTFEEMIDFDLYYVAHKSPGLDLTIIARTLPAVLWQAWESRFGATIGR
jgi:lipopolysaccharide/colanic/teichoic acid biosynthesis glycosyltransferase